MFKKSCKLLITTLSLWVAVTCSLPAAAEPQALDKVIAVVNDDVITQQELNRRALMIAAQLHANNKPLPPQNIFVKQVLEYMINERLQLQIAQSNGINADDTKVDNALVRIAQQNNMNLEQFRQVIEKDGYSYNQFREDIRHEITISEVQQRQARSQASVSEQEIDNFLKQTLLSQRNGEYRIAHILIALPEDPTPDQVAAAKEKADKILVEIKANKDFSELAASYSDGQNALEGGDLGWRNIAELPHLFLTPLINMPVGGTSDVLRNPSGFHIIKLLDKKINQSTHQVQETHARHILIKTSVITKDKDAQRILSELRQRILKNEDFGKLAREYSDDTASATEGGDLGWSSPDAFDAVFAAEMEKLAPNQISQPFKSAFGWHIVQVLGRRTMDNTQEYERNQVRQLIQRRKYEDALQDWVTQLRAAAHVEIKS